MQALRIKLFGTPAVRKSVAAWNDWREEHPELRYVGIGGRQGGVECVMRLANSIAQQEECESQLKSELDRKGSRN